MMIATAYIAGLGAPKFSDFGDFDMVLAQNVTDTNREYIKYLKGRYLRRYIILDNGEFEKEQVDAHELVKRANKIGALEIVAPDVLYNRSETIKATDKFIDSLTDDEKKSYKIQAVPQGETIRQWRDCYDHFNNHPDIDVIGLSREAIRKCFHGGSEQFGWNHTHETLMDTRIRCIRCIHNVGHKPLHLLGMTDPNEIRYYDLYYGSDRIRSVDTFVPYIYGLKGIPLLMDGIRSVHENIKVDPNQRNVDIKQKYIISHNILVFMKVSRGQTRW